MTNTNFYVSSVDLLQHAQNLGYDWNHIRNIDEFQEMFPNDSAVISFIQNDNLNDQIEDMPIACLSYLHNKDLSKIILSFVSEHNLSHCTWHFGR